MNHFPTYTGIEGAGEGWEGGQAPGGRAEPAEGDMEVTGHVELIKVLEVLTNGADKGGVADDTGQGVEG